MTRWSPHQSKETYLNTLLLKINPELPFKNQVHVSSYGVVKGGWHVWDMIRLLRRGRLLLDTCSTDSSLHVPSSPPPPPLVNTTSKKPATSEMKYEQVTNSHTWMPGKGVTSEPVAMRMFLVLMTCSVPSAVVAVTWFFPVNLPKPLTWVTCGEWCHTTDTVKSGSDVASVKTSTNAEREDWLCSVWINVRFLQSTLWPPHSSEPSSSPGSTRCLKLKDKDFIVNGVTNVKLRNRWKNKLYSIKAYCRKHTFCAISIQY